MRTPTPLPSSAVTEHLAAETSHRAQATPSRPPGGAELLAPQSGSIVPISQTKNTRHRGPVTHWRSQSQ